MRLVLDTNVLVAAQRSGRGASAKLLDGARQRKFTLIASAALFLEYEAVLTRPEHLAAAGATEADVLHALAALATLIEPVEIRFLWRPRTTDPDDDMVLEAAVNGRANVIATFDTGAFIPSASQFGVAVMTPGAAWRKVSE